ncbi:hypothetical protein SKAU_G00218370 [Synaphobranchus kaupii]|uniref:Uncharacterized protein n=1 Tax=Synaphobranchus kaupii TaxID=118154 RepID=A0A9Q1ITL8_SYNKA|nr:hypothetical protein SKAU_G00218370 [Synaphobranchus kaupii]
MYRQTDKRAAFARAACLASILSKLGDGRVEKRLELRVGKLFAPFCKTDGLRAADNVPPSRRSPLHCCGQDCVRSFCSTPQDPGSLRALFPEC